MKLYFNCPKTGVCFSSSHYSLMKGYTIITTADGERQLQGEVVLKSPCPSCGEKHSYQIKDIMCPATRSRDED
ncbi:hypothetical protein [Desulfotalea psychrophila]|uniref:Uncharacterized protein n=1 Tax=Desulfotalea psychrophila (strain LSv54 / DSM 12343) TaxID=177439 RepID=Q6APM5_DESPS|nr:hypothetical protein [Desulfotalea psychrophila]CAG35699.1 unknown protein [Desulfotalea psychrophila LSv54]